MPDLTVAQQRAYDALKEHQPLSPRALAQILYPNSKAWNKDTRRHDGRPGAVGGTMPMLGAKMLWALYEHGLAYQDASGRWWAR